MFAAAITVRFLLNDDPTYLSKGVVFVVLLAGLLIPLRYPHLIFVGIGIQIVLSIALVFYATFRGWQ